MLEISFSSTQHTKFLLVNGKLTNLRLRHDVNSNEFQEKCYIKLSGVKQCIPIQMKRMHFVTDRFDILLVFFHFQAIVRHMQFGQIRQNREEFAESGKGQIGAVQNEGVKSWKARKFHGQLKKLKLYIYIYI